ncbi:MAG: 4-hydroxythreonine-4-phosphate dehydrogenase PdxA, partial [Chitinispirillaceae bacterium]|nr:4-hydroxythreonine-4-phosphate dehydrogenase PdxA [Chitinispirillaceae bacterium]
MGENISKKNYIFALTMGDPAGIGPEITIKALSQNIEMKNSVVVIGEKSILESTANYLRVKNSFKSIKSIKEFDERYINVIDCLEISSKDFTIGKSNRLCGLASYKYIEKAIELAVNGEVGGVITNPISKESLHAAGLNYPGHTEIFAEKTGVKDFSMVFLLNNIGCLLYTS